MAQQQLSLLLPEVRWKDTLEKSVESERVRGTQLSPQRIGVCDENQGAPLLEEGRGQRDCAKPESPVWHQKAQSVFWGPRMGFGSQREE